MTATIGLSGGSDSTASININGSPVLTLDASGNLGGVAGLNGTFPSGFKNKIIGGDFTTNPWQRGTSFTAPATGSYTADRFRVTFSSDGVVNILKTTDAPTAAEAGVYTAHCLHADVTTADASIAAGQYYYINHAVEGLNAASFGFGQSGTRYVTLSFWHKHTKTGTYCVSLRNSAANRSYVAEYTQAVTDTWEKAVITIPVDTTGTWLYDTGVGILVSFAIAAGSTYQTTANTWSAGLYFATANQVNALDSTSNNFKLALIQLESGSTATTFETLDASTTLQRCQRYYYRTTPVTTSSVLSVGDCSSATKSDGFVFFPVQMRTNPTALEQSGTASDYRVASAGVPRVCSSVPIFVDATKNTAQVEFTV